MVVSRREETEEQAANKRNANIEAMIESRRNETELETQEIRQVNADKMRNRRKIDQKRTQMRSDKPRQ